MKRSATTISIATFTAAAFVLALGLPTAQAADSKTAKLDGSQQSHGFGNRGYGGPSGHGRHGRHGGHDNHGRYGGHGGHHDGHHSYRPHYSSHRPHWYGGHWGHRDYGHHSYTQHRGYYCSRCHYQTSSYSLFYNHVHHLHHIPWYDIAALIAFDAVKLHFTLGGHDGHGPHHTRHH